MTLFSVLTGSPRFDASTSWRWWSAGLICLAIMVLAMASLGVVTLAGVFALMVQSSHALGEFRAFVKTITTVQWAVVLSTAGILAQGLGVWMIWRASSADRETELNPCVVLVAGADRAARTCGYRRFDGGGGRGARRGDHDGLSA